MAAQSPHPFEDAFADLFHTLNSFPHPYCLLGALALGAWGTPRTTQDLDVLISLDREDRTRLIEQMEVRGFLVDSQWSEHNPMIREYHVRLHRNAIPVDLMLPRDAHDQECLARRRQYRLGELSLWIISPEDFVLHKLKAGRAQDFIDVLSVLQRQQQSLDRPYMTQWAQQLGIWEEWQYCERESSSSS
jgi:hypothetical protein